MTWATDFARLPAGKTRRLAAGFAVSTVLTLTFSATQTFAAELPGTAADHYASAKKAFRNGDYQVAAAAYRAADEAGFTVDRKQIVLNHPIKSLGLHDLEVHLHPEVTAIIVVNVARSQEEAEMQASGKTIQELQAEADAEAEFDIAELFDDIGAAATDDDGGDTAPAAEEAPAEETEKED